MNCPFCGFELTIRRCMYLHSVNYYYKCDASHPDNFDCRFIFNNGGNGFGSIEFMNKTFKNQYIPEYSI